MSLKENLSPRCLLLHQVFRVWFSLDVDNDGDEDEAVAANATDVLGNEPCVSGFFPEAAPDRHSSYVFYTRICSRIFVTRSDAVNKADAREKAT